VNSATAADACHGCGTTGARATFLFQSRHGPVVKCGLCALRHRPMLKRSLAVALVVGTLLVAINQGDVLFDARWSAALAWKIPLTYLVPFVVATWGALMNSRVRG
jgi:hypothetical protein